MFDSQFLFYNSLDTQVDIFGYPSYEIYCKTTTFASNLNISYQENVDLIFGHFQLQGTFLLASQPPKVCSN